MNYRIAGKFGGFAVCLCNHQIKINQNFLLTYNIYTLVIPYRTAKLKSTNIFTMAIWAPTVKFNSRQYIRLYGKSFSSSYQIRAFGLNCTAYTNDVLKGTFPLEHISTMKPFVRSTTCEHCSLFHNTDTCGTLQITVYHKRNAIKNLYTQHNEHYKRMYTCSDTVL